MAANPVTTMPNGAYLLLLLAILIGLAGLLFASQASIGAAIVGFACLLGIWARIWQAAVHHSEIMRERSGPV